MANVHLGSRLAQAINSGSLNNTISINAMGLQGGGVTGQSASFDFGWDADSHVKKYQICEIDEDLLALSTAWQRIRQERNKDPQQFYLTAITKLLDKQLFKEVTQEDRDRANVIRDYYSKKIMVWRLKNERFTKFRDDMNEFIHGDGKKFKEDMCPLVYKLPEFYDYDSSIDELAREHNLKLIDQQPHYVGFKTLNLVKTFYVGKKYSKRKEYWFSDENNDLVTLSVEHNNVLIPLLDMYTQKSFRMYAIYTKKVRDDREYLIANKFKFD